MMKYKILKSICIIIVIIVFFLCAYLTYNHLSTYHENNTITSHKTLSSEADENITKAVRLAEQDGSSYEIQGILVYYGDYDEEKLSFEIINVTDIDVELVGIGSNNDEMYYNFDNTKLIATKGTPVYRQFVFDNINDKFTSYLSDIYIDYKYDDDIIRRVSLIPYSRHNDDIFYATDIRQYDNTEEFDFITNNKNSITFEGKKIVIDKGMFIPSGTKLIIKPGQEIDIIENGYIVCYSDILCEGTKKDNIYFYTSDNTGQGIFICQSEDKSYMSYTNFNGLDTPQSGMWALTGAVTFYESDVDIANCTFENNVCEDGLNIIRSEFAISDSKFFNTFSDAFDADFSNGKITDCYFKSTANDAIDVSSTEILIFNLIAEDIGDKAISGGEQSYIEIYNINIIAALIGIASKDMSIITGENISIKNTMIGMTLYQKKVEFGPAFINVFDVSMSNDIKIDYLIEKNSEMILDNEVILPRSETKEGILFDKMKNGEPLR